MSQSITAYRPINYDSWIPGGTGANLSGLLLPMEQQIWGKALPFQDKRNDRGHAEIVTYFALKLIQIPGIKEAVKREIVVHAAILHDIGWSALSPDELFHFSLPKNRLKHQEEGARLAARILDDCKYPVEHAASILAIISEHDTRQGFLSAEDKVVRDADKLWRSTYYQVVVEHLDPKESPSRQGKQSFADFESWTIEYIHKEGMFGFPLSKEIALLEWANTKEFLKKKGYLNS